MIAQLINRKSATLAAARSREAVTAAESHAIRCQGVTKRFGEVTAVDGVELRLQPGQFLALLGPSGCGKTTMLRMLAGFEVPDGGTIEIAGQVVAGRGRWVPPERRRVGMVFQDYALFPHLNVAQNVAFGLPRRGGREERVGEVLRLVNLEELATRMPHELSGGQQQRVALARALAPEPEIVLLDEPFSNLDEKLRLRLRAETRDILLRAGTTVVFVTHEQEEALSLADQVAVMREGRILQVATPEELYHTPASREVAQFVGEANFLTGSIADGIVNCALGTFPVGTNVETGEVEIMLRPEEIDLEVVDTSGARVVDTVFLGQDRIATVLLDSGQLLRVRLDSRSRVSKGVCVRCQPNCPLRVFRPEA